MPRPLPIRWPALLAAVVAAAAGVPLAGFAAVAAPASLPPTGSATAAPETRAIPLDPAHTRVGFRLATRWGQRLRGSFPLPEGEVRVHGNGRRDVNVRLDSRQVAIDGNPRYTRWARGPEFFDVARHPLIEFRSETYEAALLRDGGDLHGTLTMRGVSRPVRFALEPSTCALPGQGCDVVASGTVDRTDFGMDGWRAVVGDDVRFELRVRTLAPGEDE